MNTFHRERLLAGLPETIRHALGDRPMTERRLGRSGNRVFAVGRELYLKISTDVSALRRERDTELWLEGRLTAPRVVEYAEDDTGRCYLVTDTVRGTPACCSPYVNRPENLCALLADAAAMVHSVCAADCPFLAEQTDARRELGTPAPGQVFVHGDFCLPNVLLLRGTVSGVVDVAGAGVGDPWLDFAWCLWSLGYNTHGDVPNPALLRALGIEWSEAKYREFVSY